MGQKLLKLDVAVFVLGNLVLDNLLHAEDDFIGDLHIV